ncbi:Superoxide dismutase [Paramicrosporidium saccamoebae]|uniref:Superoxide dismutase n=1 Tax=Paramicrosporidium saccamoebae TaxID=1246581 RepID=A0A2H9TR30_9FUNG|nr:Superoxide dismutase [Paramicrosporidium saccamoebae]
MFVIRHQRLTKCISQALLRRSKYTLPDLPYDYRALEPVVSEEIMRLHHQKHHQAYVNNLNAALEKFSTAQKETDLATQAMLTSQINFNGGGHINHSIFWQNLCPPDKALGKPDGPLLKAIENEFGSFEDFKTFFATHTGAIQGSGWGWLGFNPVAKRVQFATTANQDPLLATRGLVPLLGMDVWEHAYYLQYKNMRPDYIKSMWAIINWEDVSHRFAKVTKS